MSGSWANATGATGPRTTKQSSTVTGRQKPTRPTGVWALKASAVPAKA